MTTNVASRRHIIAPLPRPPPALAPTVGLMCLCFKGPRWGRYGRGEGGDKKTLDDKIKNKSETPRKQLIPWYRGTRYTVHSTWYPVPG